ncbi:MAG TPA: YHS domain-containing protein [Gemmataceae bacterium]|nr:YHS domain-containing protein [Gemmataceae bacterium]
MKRMVAIVLALPLAATALAAPAEPGGKRTPKEALKPLHDLIGSWRGTGVPEGTREQKQRGFWVETIKWQWQFKGDDAWLKADFEKGKHFQGAELRYLPDRDRYQMTVKTAGGESLVFIGELKDRVLTLDRADDRKKETQRLVVTLLHGNRYLYRWETRPAGRVVFTKHYQVGATKEGVPFATGDNKPECIVSGGLGTMPVMYKGQTYYVCCSGCRDAFKEDPEKYVKEYEAKRKKGK